MWTNYFKIAWRTLLKQRQFTLLNLAGLSTGLACAFLIYLWVTDERAMDKFHRHRIYQVVEHASSSSGVTTSPYQPGLLADAIKQEIPGVAMSVTASRPDTYPLAVGDNSMNATGIYASADYFSIFNYPLLHGGLNNGIVISAALAEKLFHTTNAVGKTVLFNTTRNYEVTGVFAGTPARSSTQFDFVLPFADLRMLRPNVNNWGFNTSFCYLVLDKATDINAFNRQIAGLVTAKTGDTTRHIQALNYADNYLFGKYENGKQAGGRIEYVRLFSLIALFILLIACINFMNLSTARASGRMKEVGVRKSVGAARIALVWQYLGESVLMSLLSLVLAVLLVLLLLPVFNSVTGKQLELRPDWQLLFAFTGIAVAAGVIAGSYPALYLSGFNPVAILKGRMNNAAGALWARKGLVGFQFAVSVALLVAVVVVYKQISFVRHKNLGYNRENILQLHVNDNMEELLTAAKRVPGVVAVSSIGQTITGGGSNTLTTLDWPGKKPADKFVFEVRPVHYGAIEMLGIQMADGRAFSTQFPADSLDALIFNESAIKAMGLENPVGQTVKIQGGSFRIIGVAKDFHFASLHEAVNPLFFVLRPTWTHKLMVKLQAGSETGAIAGLQQLYGQYQPGVPFSYNFLDEYYEKQYTSEKRVAVLSKYFAALAVLISCLGLFGLAAYSAERRRKEIGIRKVLGAGTMNLLLLLSRDFMRPVLIAIVIATPLVWWAMSNWLERFAFHIPLRADVFIWSGAGMIVLMLLTVGFQGFRAAMANPIGSLRSE